MFKKSNPEGQISLFNSTKELLNEKSKKKFNDPNAWHYLFHNNVLSRIDEDHFRPLFDQVQEDPNSSIKLLIGMIILKESLHYSDKQLFEQCEFNLLVRSALGVINIDDPLPFKFTYYLLRKRIYLFIQALVLGDLNLKDFLITTNLYTIDYLHHTGIYQYI